MSQAIAYAAVINRLTENAIPFFVLPLQAEARIVVAQRGGRIFGPFLNARADSLTWMNDCFVDSAAFQRFLESGDWNLGGERLWIAPEWQYNIGDPDDIFGSYDLPAAVDPGHYALIPQGNSSCILRQTISLNARILHSGTKSLNIQRWIRPSANPLYSLAECDALMQGVRFAGYEHRVRLEEFAQDEIMSEAWIVTQVYPGGEVLIPTYGSAEFADYYEAAGDLQRIQAREVRLKITGDQRYKLGYAAACLSGRFGYLADLPDQLTMLLVRDFPNNPALPYVEGQPPSVGGHSLHIFNDDGGFGGYGELECQGQPIGGLSGYSQAEDNFTLWCFVGQSAHISPIAQKLLGIDLLTGSGV